MNLDFSRGKGHFLSVDIVDRILTDRHTDGLREGKKYGIFVSQFRGQTGDRADQDPTQVPAVADASARRTVSTAL